MIANEVSASQPLIRAIAANDTLHHPDAYAHFAMAVSGPPGALDMYCDQSIDVTATVDGSAGKVYLQVVA